LRRERFEDGILRERWDDDSTPRMYTAWSASGVQTSTRSYTPEENARADADAAIALADTNRQSIEASLAAELDEIQVEFLTPTNAALNTAFAANNARYLKILARIMRRIIRLIIRRFDGTT
jgi:hypothetical protein